ncbi:AI-2E family transporter [Cellulomonas sp. PhB150]|uniref:AI-2E family transporter n=1 Tax=Cellulomonas sp. PhB150 TaxID=2485188 RepID=UPI000F49C1E0|nr:AI-2E family transporter [Cellulomonas sp. PhB150]ROS30951.1 putative PurR-regulated permease PerM [Cellulomonas sp. PhB150]
MAEPQFDPFETPEAHRPPPWLWRALLMGLVTVIVGIWVWRSLGLLTNVITIVVIAWFIALAMEPSIKWLVRHGIRRTRATGIVMASALIGGAVILVLFGGLFIDQLVQLIASLPDYYTDLATWLDSSFDVQIPAADEAVANIGAHWRDLAPGLVGAGASVVSGLFTASAVLLVVYYMASQGPKFRAAVLRLFAPNRQVEVLRLWEVSQAKVADFITSRLVLAGLSTAFTFVFLTIVHVPYALPLAAFTGIVSQFIPTIGTYIGGALPVAVALTISPAKGVVVLLFIIAYQQVENLIFSPKVSAQSLELNPAVSFLGVIGFGALFGAMGAFLALPVLATIQAVSHTYIRRHDLVDSPLLQEDVAALKRNRGWNDLPDDVPDEPQP